MAINTNSPFLRVRKNSNGKLRKITHQKPYQLPITVSNATDAAIAYITELDSEFDVAQQLQNITIPAQVNLSKTALAIHIYGEKDNQGVSIRTFSQTYLGIPLWKAFIGVRLGELDLKIFGATSYIVYQAPTLSPHSQTDIEKYSRIDATELQTILNFGTVQELQVHKSDKLFIYRYKDASRFGPSLTEIDLPIMTRVINSIRLTTAQDNSDHVVREVLFSYNSVDIHLNWRCFISVLTGEILHLNPFIAAANGKVFDKDPQTQGGNPTSSAGDIILNEYSISVNLPRLEPPSGGVQELRGDASTGYARIVDPIDDASHPIYQHLFIGSTSTDPPSKPANESFDYNVRSYDFAAVCAYYNVDRFLALIEEVGILLKPNPNNPNLPFYFPTTTFPLGVNHFAPAAGINAFIQYDPDLTFTRGIVFGSINNNPVGVPGMATSYRITLHEFGHILIVDHVHDLFFGFAHSFGDGLAAILNDPDSQASDRFATFPWAATEFSQAERRHDRSITNGYAWGGTLDPGEPYDTEQILSTTLFRAYRSYGGDAISPNRKVFASRLMLLLMLNSVRRMTPETNPEHAEDYADFLMEADLDTSFLPNTIDSVPLGAFHKVIRWAFEKQGAYQMVGQEGNFEGLPPLVDIYIDDGRDGEYEYMSNFWNSTDLVNRTSADGGQNHQIPILGATNYLYVRVQNRGQESANNIVLKGFHCIPSGGLVWPQDWQAMQTAQINFPGSIAQGVTEYIGPFEWIPTNQGHECLMVTVSADGDEPNTESVLNIPHWALVPHDNNIAQRNVAPVPGFTGGGVDTEFTKAFQIFQFTVKNPYKKDIIVELEVVLPLLLKSKGWSLDFPLTGSRIVVKNFDRIGVLVNMKMIPGQPFTRQDVINTQDRDITINMVAEDGLIGGMTYRIDPDLDTYKERL